MAFPEDQISFCGATIREFRTQLGYSDQPSSLSTTLVEDDKLNQNFIPPTIGSPAYFEYNGWSFGGVFQSWTRTRSSGGFTYEVVLNDPRSILNGARVILYGYSGITFGVPNIYNVFGYLENANGFGGSGASEQRGINARLAITTLQGLIETTPIEFNGFSYKVDLSNLINLCDENYYIQGMEISLLDLITSVATDSISDFFIRLEYRNLQNYIVPYFVSRKNPPIYGAIGNFINVTENTYGNVSNTVGRELIAEPTSKMIIGGKVCKIYYTDQTLHSRFITGLKADNTFYDNNFDLALTEHAIDQNGISRWKGGVQNSKNNYIDWRDKIRRKLQSNAEEASIWPYWGHDARGDLVIGYGIVNSTYTDNNYLYNRDLSFSHKMIIDGRQIAEIMAPWHNNRAHPSLVDYMTDVAELEFALEGFDEWLRYITLTSCVPLHHNRYYHIEDGFDTSKYANEAKYFTKLDILGFANETSIDAMMKDLDSAVYRWFNGDTPQLNTNVLSAVNLFISNTRALLSAKAKLDRGVNDPWVNLADDLMDVYRVIYNFADKHLGKTYMVRTPSIQAKRDPDTENIVYSVQPTSGGFFEESVWEEAIATALMPADVNKIIDQADGRIKTYVRFDNHIVENNGFKYGKLNPNLIGLQNIATNKNIDNENNPYDDYFFVPCETEQEPVFLDNATLDSPRMVVVLPEKMVVRLPKGYKHIATMFTHMIMHYKYYVYESFNNFVGNIDMQARAGREAMRLTSSDVGNDGYINSTLGAPVVMPDMAFVALESNVERYGPWFKAGISGPSEVEISDDLVPWNYGGFTELNLVANARLTQAGANRLEVERGTIEFPGAPTYLLGDSMVANGPVITSINVQIDPQAGVTTTYNLQSYTPQFGDIPKIYADKLNALNKIRFNHYHLVNEINRLRRPGASNVNFKAGTGRESTRASRKDSIHSSMILLGASHINLPDRTKASAAAMPGYYLENQAGDMYENKAFMSMDGMFRPYTTETQVDNSGMPHFESPTSDAETPNVNDLNPWGGNHDVAMVSRNLNLETTDVDNPFENTYLRTVDSEPAPTSIKAVALKGPLVVAGWGYDTNGKPVPANTGNPEEFAPNYRCREDLWKTGPVDLRWDNNKKIWTPNKESYIGIAKEDIFVNTSGRISILGFSDAEDNIIINDYNPFEEKYVYYINQNQFYNSTPNPSYDYSKYTNNCIPSGTTVIVSKLENYDKLVIINDFESRIQHLQSLSLALNSDSADDYNSELLGHLNIESSFAGENHSYNVRLRCKGYYLFDLDFVVNGNATEPTETVGDTIAINLQYYKSTTNTWETIESSSYTVEFNRIYLSGMTGPVDIKNISNPNRIKTIFFFDPSYMDGRLRLSASRGSSYTAGDYWTTGIVAEGYIEKLRVSHVNGSSI